MSTVTKIALTGGPCGGKSTSISTLEQELTDKGYKVFVVDEMATNVILSGAGPRVISGFEFQKAIIKLQYERSKVYDEIAKKYSEDTGKPVVIVYDRGIPDGKAFISKGEYLDILASLGLSDMEVMDYYDGVFHLTTAADGATEFYTLLNNAARTETTKEAMERDRDCLKAWAGHNHLRVLKNDCSFEKKVENLIKEVHALLGIPSPLETERKFVVSRDGLNEAIKDCEKNKVDIVQTYLTESKPGVERRVRQRGVGGDYTFYYTEKQKVSDVTRVETERKISKEEYIGYLMEADSSLHQVRKQRTCFVYEGQYFELDEYPFWDDKAILEIELASESQAIRFPSGMSVLKEVTSDDRYKNGSLAKTLGDFEDEDLVEEHER